MGEHSMRCKELRITNELLVDMFRMDGTRRIKMEGMPADAKLVDMFTLTADGGFITLLLESSTFDVVTPGTGWPRLDITISEVK